jgi:hypothetical protein
MQNPELPNPNSLVPIEKPEIANIENTDAVKLPNKTGFILQVLKYDGFDSEAFQVAMEKHFDELDEEANSKYPDSNRANIEAEVKKIELYIEIKRRVPSAYKASTLLEYIDGAIDAAQQQETTGDLAATLNDLWNEVNIMNEGKLPNLSEK